MKTLITLIMLTTSYSAFAACEAVKWPLTDYPAKRKELVSTLNGMPRAQILSYYMYEISNLDHAKEAQLKFARDLHFYLLNTASGIKSQALIETVGQLSAIESAQPESIPVAQFCGLKKQIDSAKYETQD